MSNFDERSARVAIAQMAIVTCDIEANVKLCLELVDKAVEQNVDLLVFPELCLTGYDVEGHVEELARTTSSPEIQKFVDASIDGPSMMIGFIENGGDGFYYNAAAYIEQGEVVHVQRKLYLPTYGVLSEARLFCAGERFTSFPTRFGKMAMLICEDAWHTSLPYLAVMGGATMLLTVSASPTGGTSADVTSEELWTAVNRATAVQLKVFNIYANLVGSEGNIRYWGGSHIISPSGKIVAKGPIEEEAFITTDIDLNTVDRQRYAFRYVQDERMSTTLRELQLLAGQRWGS